MKYQSQSFYPTKSSLVTIEECAKKIAPEDQKLAKWHKSYLSNHKLRVALDLDIVKEQVVEGSNVLEFGSVPLLFTAGLSTSNYGVTGIDIAPERYKGTIDKLGIEIVKCDIELEKLPFDDNTFDAIVFNELFEHLRINPIFTLSEVLRVLKTGGILLLSSPNLRSLNGLYNFLINNRSFSCSGDIFAQYQKLEKLGHMGHVREYTTKEISAFLKRIGFDVTTIIYRGRYKTKGKQLLAKLQPNLRPFASYVAKKPI